MVIIRVKFNRQPSKKDNFYRLPSIKQLLLAVKTLSNLMINFTDKNSY